MDKFTKMKGTAAELRDTADAAALLGNYSIVHFSSNTFSYVYIHTYITKFLSLPKNGCPFTVTSPGSYVYNVVEYSMKKTGYF